MSHHPDMLSELASLRRTYLIREAAAERFAAQVQQNRRPKLADMTARFGRSHAPTLFHLHLRLLFAHFNPDATEA